MHQVFAVFKGCSEPVRRSFHHLLANILKLFVFLVLCLLRGIHVSQPPCLWVHCTCAAWLPSCAHAVHCGGCAGHICSAGDKKCANNAMFAGALCKMRNERCDVQKKRIPSHDVNKKPRTRESMCTKMQWFTVLRFTQGTQLRCCCAMHSERMRYAMKWIEETSGMLLFAQRLY